VNILLTRGKGYVRGYIADDLVAAGHNASAEKAYKLLNWKARDYV
jgi:hypothetical protein